MKIELKNANKFNSNFYKGIEINEFYNEVYEKSRYLVKFFGRDPWFDTSFVGIKRTDEIYELSSEDKIRMIIKDYLESTRINYFTGIVRSLSIYGNMYFIANGTRYLLFNVKNLSLRTIINDVYNKYIDDRYEFCYKDNGIKSFYIDTGDFSRYEIINGKLPDDNTEEDIMSFTLKIDNKGIIESECEFIKEFIIEKFSRYNEEIEIVYELEYLRRGILLKCRDMKMYFPNYNNLLWIIDVVNKYNNELININNNIKKKQLKMEGF